MLLKDIDEGSAPHRFGQEAVHTRHLTIHHHAVEGAVPFEHIEGRVHRAYCRWWPNGRKRIEGEFHHGVPVGLWRVWDGHGNHVYEGPWRSDFRAQLGPELSSTLRSTVPEDTPRSVGYRHGTYANVA